MPKVTILGAGITGMAIASQLPRDYDVTIVGEFLPGDDLDQRYTSQWAGAIWMGTNEPDDREKRWQIGGLANLWSIAEKYPESSVRKATFRETKDYGTAEDVWYRHHVPDWQLIPQAELPQGAKFGMKYTTVVLTPPVFIIWLRARLEERGVVFKRSYVKALSDLQGMGHDVLVNATGLGASKLEDVMEKRFMTVRQQNLRIKTEGYNGIFMRRGLDNYYSTAFGRYDGTIYIGGVKSEYDEDFRSYEDQRAIIMQRAHDNNPDIFPSPNPLDYEFITDHTGVYAYITKANGGPRLEKEIMGSQKVVHAYGMEFGFVCSFGLGRDAADLVTDFLFASPK